MSDCHRPASFGFPAWSNTPASLRPMLAGPFMAAAAVRLARVHAGQAFTYAARKMPAWDHHAGMVAKKSSNSGNSPAYGKI
jgi:fructose-1,6-bisphosphatase/inositol monophosphatase family enzyme